MEKQRLSVETSTEISDLRSETVKSVSDLSTLTFNTLSTEISDLSSDTSREISVAKALTSSEITDLQVTLQVNYHWKNNRLSEKLLQKLVI